VIRAAIIGHPVAQSLSPLIHGHWFREYNIEGTYGAVDITPADLGPRLKSLCDEGYSGFNVTMPHKQSIMTLCDTLDDTARAIGAVNTIVISDKRIEGRNTDVFGFIENLKQEQPGYDFKSRPVVVLGAGGAARAVVYGLLQEGVPEIRLSNRTRKNAEILAHDFQRVTVIHWDDRADSCSEAGLLTNTTLLGMKGQPTLDMNLDRLPNDAVVCDIVYKPLQTPLLQDAKARGLATVTGICMLLHQARPAFAAWTGTMPAVTKELEQMIAEPAL